MDKHARIVFNEMQDLIKVKPSWRKKAEFHQWSCQKWALQELYDIIMTPDTAPAMIKVEEFRNRMEDYSFSNSSFSAAYDMATYIMDLFLDCDNLEYDDLLGKG